MTVAQFNKLIKSQPHGVLRIKFKVVFGCRKSLREEESAATAGLTGVMNLLFHFILQHTDQS